MNKQLQEFIARHIAPVLSAAGFSGEHAAFFRDRQWCLDIIEVQELQANSSQVRFTFNLGLCIPEVERVVWGNECELRTASCLLRRRVGDIVDTEGGKKLDVWWTLNDDQVEVRVEQLLLGVALPFFDKLDTLDNLRKEAINSPSWLQGQALHKIYMAVLEAKVGNKSTAAKLLKSFHADRMMSAWIPKIRKAAEEFSIDLNISSKATE